MYDPYSVLGLPRNAGEDEVKHAFRRLAKRFHPDTPEGASDKGRRFKDLSIAYEILGDARKRRAYDRGEIDAHGNPRAGYRPPPETQAQPEPSSAAPHAQRAGNRASGARAGSAAAAGAQPAGAAPGNGKAGDPNADDAGSSFRSAFERAFGGTVGGTGGTSGESRSGGRTESRVEDLFAEFFGDQSEAPRRPGDGPFDLQITFEEAVLGGTRRVKLANGKRFDVRIPIGVKDGHAIRLSGSGAPGETGEAQVVIAVEAHPFYRREGNDILLNLPITLAEALQGAKINVPTLHGPVAMTIPGGSSSGLVLRLKGKGVPAHTIHAAGDQLVTLQICLPDTVDSELADMIKRWETQHPYDPRMKLGSV